MYNKKNFVSLYSRTKEKYEKTDTYERTDLCDMFDKNKSDKSYPSDIEERKADYWYDVEKKNRSVHNYSLFYDTIFSDFKNNNISLFEMGIGSNNPRIPHFMGVHARPGASLYAWSEYFKNGKIYWADLDSGSVFEDKKNRIKTYQCDQKDGNRVDEIFSSIDSKLDIIIDDGRHHPDYNKKFFESSFHYLKDGGIYVIEDIFLAPHSANFKKRHLQNLEDIKKTSSFADIIRLKNDFNNTDNNLLVVLKWTN